jgi:hypothetical protein
VDRITRSDENEQRSGKDRVELISQLAGVSLLERACLPEEGSGKDQGRAAERYREKIGCNDAVEASVGIATCRTTATRVKATAAIRIGRRLVRFGVPLSQRLQTLEGKWSDDGDGDGRRHGSPKYGQTGRRTRGAKLPTVGGDLVGMRCFRDLRVLTHSRSSCARQEYEVPP